MIVFAPAILIGLLIAFFLSKSLNALLLGETYARSMGMNVQRVRHWIIVSTALLAGTVTAFCGPIAFLGIAVPHICRSLFNTSDHRVLIPATILMGGIVAIVAHLVYGIALGLGVATIWWTRGFGRSGCSRRSVGLGWGAVVESGLVA